MSEARWCVFAIQKTVHHYKVSITDQTINIGHFSCQVWSYMLMAAATFHDSEPIVNYFLNTFTLRCVAARPNSCTLRNMWRTRASINNFSLPLATDEKIWQGWIRWRNSAAPRPRCFFLMWDCCPKWNQEFLHLTKGEFCISEWHFQLFTDLSLSRGQKDTLYLKRIYFSEFSANQRWALLSVCTISCSISSIWPERPRRYE